jgi:non-ribosomal peptide synthetase component F
VSSLASLLRKSIDENLSRVAIEMPSSRRRLTYAQLAARADYWRSVLGGDPRPAVLYLSKTLNYYEILAYCFLYGRSFCPVDRVNPPGRLQRLADQFKEPAVLVDDDESSALLASSHHRVLDVRGLSPAPGPAEQVGDGGEAGPFYYISTSGSTGVPRIVKVRHNATVAFLKWALPFYGCGPGMRWAQFSSNGFDLSIVDFLTVLVGGGTLVVVCTALERARAGEFVDGNRITHWHSVPTVIPYLLQDDGVSLGSLKLLSFCGEPLLASQCRRLRGRAPDARIINTYGPTEGTLFCSFHEVSADDLERVGPTSLPIGHPIPGWSFVFIESESSYRLVIVGNNLAEGYLGPAGGGFSQIQLGGSEVLSTFDTGDYFDVRADGIFFSHRRDAMVKVKGNRVDLGDVGNACVQAGISQPFVLCVSGQLVLFIENQVVEKRALAGRLHALLPPYAVPARFVSMPTLPRTPNGKIDRMTLARYVDESNEAK